MLHHRVFASASIAGLLIAVGSCATTMKPPVVNSGPVQSNDGVAVAVLRQACSQIEPVDEVPTAAVDETVEVEVQNGSPGPLTVHPDRFRLIAADGGTPATAASRAGATATIAQGDARTFEVQFVATGGLACTKEMRLDASGGITRQDSPVALQPVPFRPL